MLRLPWFWFRFVSAVTAVGLLCLCSLLLLFIIVVVAPGMARRSPPDPVVLASLTFLGTLAALLIVGGVVVVECIRTRETASLGREHWIGACRSLGSILIAALLGWLVGWLLGDHAATGTVAGISLVTARLMDPLNSCRFYSWRFLNLWREREPDWEFVYRDEDS